MARRSIAVRGIALACAVVVLWPGVATAAPPLPPPPPSPTARSGASMAAFGDNQVILFGGQGDSGAMADTWSWDGTTWTELHPATSPPARAGAVMSYDAVRGRTVLFGGRRDSADGTQFLRDTWTWDGTNWSAYPVTAGSPAERSDAAMAPDLATGTLLLFGGRNAGGPLGDTWSWDGLAWVPRLLQGEMPPTPRHGAGMATMRDHIVLFGGETDGYVLRDAYIWSNGWTRRCRACPPSPRRYHAMAGSGGGPAVLFGGESSDGAFHFPETWLWDGMTWTPVSLATHPTARSSAAMAYLGATSTMVLFGGADAAGVLGDTWTWNGSSWQLIGATSTKKGKK